MKWWQHFFCSWTKWSTPDLVSFKRTFRDGVIDSVELWQQERICSVCNKYQRRLVDHKGMLV